MNEWVKLLKAISSASFGDPNIASQIVKLGKPKDDQRIAKAASTVARFLSSPVALERHEAVWFLGCLGELAEYQGPIAKLIDDDPDLDNQAFAARCLGRSLGKHPDRNLLLQLRSVVKDESRPITLRLTAYGAILWAIQGEPSRKLVSEFQTYETKTVSDVDLAWLEAL